MPEPDLSDKMQSGKRAWSRSIADNPKSIQVKEFCRDVFTWGYWRMFWPSLAEERRSSWRSLVWAGRKAGWWRIAGYLFCYGTVITLAIILPFLYLSAWSYQFTGGTTCLPDGRFALDSSYSLWDISGLFQITMGFGSLSFSNAKLLDAIWDVVRDSKR